MNTPKKPTPESEKKHPRKPSQRGQSKSPKASVKDLQEKHDVMAEEHFLNRELSWLAFNNRVLDEVNDIRHPLLERLKFLAIFSSNLDEFFMIRVAGLKEQFDSEVESVTADGRTVSEQLQEIREHLIPMLQKQMHLLTSIILPAMDSVGIVIHQFEELTSRDKNYLEGYFSQNIFPLLTPLSIDSGHPFPQVLNRTLNLLFTVGNPQTPNTAPRTVVLQLPQQLPRFVRVPRKSGHHFVPMEEIIQTFSDMLFPNLLVKESFTFRVSRDADIEVAEDEAGDLLAEMTEQVRKRRWGAVVRLELDANAPPELAGMLMNMLDIEEHDLYRISGPANINDFMELTSLDVRHHKYPQLTSIGRLPQENAQIFAALRRRDYMAHHPFHSFTRNVIKFIETAASDHKVLAIKITLYRTGRNSQLLDALKLAAHKGKQVTAFIELKARFDEETNILWANELEKEGVHVVYGIVGLKTHCKIMLVVRKEEDRIRTYVHLSTGNYNQSTSRVYTDISYFTAREDVGSDAVNLFNFLTGYSQCTEWNHFAVAPLSLRSKIIELIRREADLHTQEKPGEIFAKMNALVDTKVIQELYKASQKGVKIKLIIRGVCCLRPGVPGLSENIEVRSILGRFLEHSRIISFRNGGNQEIYLSSADWMPRNLNRRVEIMWPILEESILHETNDILYRYWHDNTKAHILDSTGTYTLRTPHSHEAAHDSQREFVDDVNTAKKQRPQFIPQTKPHA